jgi:hypothetical protein
LWTTNETTLSFFERLRPNYPRNKIFYIIKFFEFITPMVHSFLNRDL